VDDVRPRATPGGWQRSLKGITKPVLRCQGYGQRRTKGTLLADEVFVVLVDNKAPVNDLQKGQ
jgi:hypothetical protein